MDTSIIYLRLFTNIFLPEKIMSYCCFPIEIIALLLHPLEFPIENFLIFFLLLYNSTNASISLLFIIFFSNGGDISTISVISSATNLLAFADFAKNATAIIIINTEYSCAMKSHFRKFGNQMSGSGNHLCNYASLLA